MAYVALGATLDRGPKSHINEIRSAQAADAAKAAGAGDDGSLRSTGLVLRVTTGRDLACHGSRQIRHANGRSSSAFAAVEAPPDSSALNASSASSCFFLRCCYCLGHSNCNILTTAVLLRSMMTPLFLSLALSFSLSLSHSSDQCQIS